MLCRAKDVISTEMDGDTVILEVVSGNYSGLDSIGTLIWNLLESPISFEDIVQHVLRSYDVNEEQCRKDLKEFVDDLMEKKLITNT